jgi:hypothetical protein
LQENHIALACRDHIPRTRGVAHTAVIHCDLGGTCSAPHRRRAI